MKTVGDKREQPREDAWAYQVGFQSVTVVEISHLLVMQCVFIVIEGHSYWKRVSTVM